MNDELQKIRDTKAQYQRLIEELQTLQKKIENTRERRTHAILFGLDNAARDADHEIVRLQEKIKGIQGAVKALEPILKKMDEEKAIRQRDEKIKQVELLKIECIEILKNIYALLAEAVGKNNELRAKYTEYKNGMRSLNQHHLFIPKVSNLLAAFKSETLQILARFPVEIFKDGKLQKPEELKRSLK